MSVRNSIITVGDSISDRPYGHGWADVIKRHHIYVEDNSTGGTEIVGDMEPKFIAGGEWSGRRDNCNIAILQGGINDLKGFSVYGNDEDVMFASMTAMINQAKADGATVFVMNVAPWKSYIGWSVEEQAMTDAYNALLAANDSVLGYTLIDLYSLLEDPSTPDTLLPAYDNRDGLHPTSPVARDVIVNEVLSFIAPLIEEEPMLNPIKLWRGAVQPASVSPLGNQLKIWRGAVQPVVTKSSTITGTNNGVAISIDIGI
tara:strand:- start:75 stop:848 length:774 start_codon:yes stop_codon:yes gene_type:complete